MASKSKNKGKRYERQVAQMLSDLFEDSFIRVPNSGAYVGGKNAVRRSQLTDNQNKTFKGDIIPPDNFNLIIECKNYEKISGGLAAIIRGVSVQLNKWIKELRGDAGELEDRDQLDPHILFLKLTRVGEWFVVPRSLYIDDIDKLPRITYFYSDAEYSVLDIQYFKLFKEKITTETSQM